MALPLWAYDVAFTIVAVLRDWWVMFSTLIGNVSDLGDRFHDDLCKLEATLENLLGQSEFFNIFSPFALNRGKRLRSLLYFKNWHAASKIGDKLKYKTIALIELLHLASIIHDDVVDGSGTRRGMTSFPKVHGQKKSVLCGDFLFVNAINAFLELHSDNEFVKRLFLRECAATAYGAVLEQQLDTHSSIFDCVRVAALKTASLFKMVCFLGTFLSTGDFQTAKKAARWGICFGIIFQVQNDLDSYKPENFENSEDFLQKNITFPILLLRDKFGYDIANFSALTQDEYMRIKEVIKTRNFENTAREILKKYLNEIENM
ncbi:MAG: polyprenyl synthetase family protein [Alphaproteobacteria bacterium]|nr:polyprenyl synthetase family protein [Alphaproteobacteria bacterium]